MTGRELIQAELLLARERIGQLRERLNACGPRGNHSVEQALDYEQGRGDALALALDFMTRPDAS